MQRAMEKIIRAAENRPHRENEYLAENGLLHCRVCGKATQTRITDLLDRERIVRCICDCEKQERDAYKLRLEEEERERRRRDCFRGTNMRGWNFHNDDRALPKLSDAMKRYADNFREYRKDGKGLLLYGPVETGKTFYAACIANRIIDAGGRALMSNFSQLSNDLGRTFEKNEYIESLNRYSLLIIDDLGAERKSDYMQEQVFNIIDSRYRSGLPMIITTNLTREEITNPDGIGYARIYSRILERCLPVEVKGVNRRRSTAGRDNADMRQQLGL